MYKSNIVTDSSKSGNTYLKRLALNLFKIIWIKYGIYCLTKFQIESVKKCIACNLKLQIGLLICKGTISKSEIYTNRLRFIWNPQSRKFIYTKPKSSSFDQIRTAQNFIKIGLYLRAVHWPQEYMNRQTLYLSGVVGYNHFNRSKNNASYKWWYAILSHLGLCRNASTFSSNRLTFFRLSNIYFHRFNMFRGSRLIESIIFLFHFHMLHLFLLRATFQAVIIAISLFEFIFAAHKTGDIRNCFVLHQWLRKL